MNITPEDEAFQPADFAFTEENLAAAEKIIKRYPEGRQRSAVMPLLDLVQRQEGWVPLAAMRVVAAKLDMAEMRVYEVATFYTMFNLKPVGKHFIQLCTNIACKLRGVDVVLETCQHELGIGVGETSADGQFTLVESECLGACVNAPVAWIGDYFYEDLDVANTKSLLDQLKRGEAPKPGSQTGRQGSCPAGGPSTLLELAAPTSLTTPFGDA